METINKLEVTIASWYKGMPHLPDNFRQWIANNVWWIVLVGVILSLMVIIPAVGALLFSGAVITAYGASQSAYYGAAFIPAIVALVIFVADIVLTIMAISPLKVHAKRGWTLLFITMLLGVLSTILTLLSNQDFGGFLWGLVGAAIGLYLLFEIRDRFGVVAAKAKASPATVETPTAKKA